MDKFNTVQQNFSMIETEKIEQKGSKEESYLHSHGYNRQSAFLTIKNFIQSGKWIREGF